MEFLTNPDKFFREIKERLSYKLPLTIVLAAAILNSINGYIVAIPMKRAVERMLVEQGLPRESIQMALTITQISAILMPIVTVFTIWIVTAVLIHAISSIFGGEGKFSMTLKLSAFSFIPNIVVFPLNLYVSLEMAKILDVYGLEGLKGSFSLVSIIIGILVLIWQFIYWIFIAKNARNLEIKGSIITASVVFVLFLIPSLYSLIFRF